MFLRFLPWFILALMASLNQATWSASDYDKGIEAYSEKNYSKARALWEKASSGGNISAAFNLGILLSKGLGGNKDLERATSLFRRAADAGLPAAQYNIALAYYQGNGVVQSAEQAQIWWERAARQSHVESQFNLGAMLWNGDGILKNSSEGLKWFRKASEGGSKQASAFLDQIFEHIPPDADFTETEESDNTKQPNQNIAIQKDVVKALEHAHQAYKERKYKAALKNWSYAAKHGHFGAQYQLARLYEAGLGTKVNNQRAFDLYKSSAEAGQPQAQFHLAQYYLNGDIVEKNESLGLYWIQSAADNNDIRAKDYLEQAR